jgi:hypothetical protein
MNPTCVYITLDDIQQDNIRKQNNDDGGKQSFKSVSRYDIKNASSQDAKVDLKLLIVSVIPIYGLSDTINLFCVLVFILINKLITFSAS